jgi:hypothetical protein
MNQFLSKFSGTQLSRRKWRLNDMLRYMDDKYGIITAPANFETDLASIEALRYVAPLLFCLLAGYGNAACTIHDMLYKEGSLARSDADSVLYRALKAEGVEPWRARVFWAGVRVFGKSHYNDNGAKPLGEPVVVQL